VLKKYTKNIAESRDVAILSTLIVILLRAVAFFTSTDVPDYDGGPLWVLIEPFFANRYISFFGSLIATFGIAFYITYLNGKYALIRGRTYLPFAFTLFLLSFSEIMAFMAPEYIGVILILYSIDQLFDAYQQPLASRQAFKISFSIALASLFVPGVLIYIPVFWIGFSYMRSNGFKIFLASLMGIVMVLWIAMSVSFLLDKTDAVYASILVVWDSLKDVSILQLDIDDILILVLGTITFVIIVFDNYINGYKDKIRIRSNYSFLNLIAFSSILIYLFLTLHMQICLITALAVSGLVLAHFFALADKKWKVYFFIIIVLSYFGVYVHLLFND